MGEYTDYCTCFYVAGENKVHFHDEIKNSTISTRKVKDESEATMVMKSWVDNAPEGVICQMI